MCNAYIRMGRVKREMDARGVIMLFLSIFWGGGGQRGEESRRGEGVTVSCGRCRPRLKRYTAGACARLQGVCYTYKKHEIFDMLPEFLLE